VQSFDVILVYANRRCNRIVHELAKKISNDMVAGSGRRSLIAWITCWLKMVNVAI
jgi:hypothetical protein